MTVRIAKSRRGVSLTELLMLMSSCTMILSLCAVLLHRVMRVEIESRSFVAAEQTSERLGHQFREDVHQATAAETAGSKLNKDVILRLQLPDDQTIEYMHANGNVLRTASHNGKVGARDEFAFEPACKLSIHQVESPRRLVLSITSPALELASDRTEQLQAYKALPVGLYVEASIGRDVAFASPPGGQERAK
jgi:hypothetical protein